MLKCLNWDIITFVFPSTLQWRKRWFKLWENKILEYYEEKGGRLKNSIDLNLCTCVESNLYHKKFPNTFSITIKGKQDGKFLDRTYYLVAESSYEMKSWIDQICKICDFQKTDGYTRGKHFTVTLNHSYSPNKCCVSIISTAKLIHMSKSLSEDYNYALNQVFSWKCKDWKRLIVYTVCFTWNDTS